MIALDRNYRIQQDSTHGFQLNYQGDPVLKEVTTKKGKVEREVVPSDTWYFPRLSQALNQYYKEVGLSDLGIKMTEDKIKSQFNFNNLSKVLTVNGKVKEV